MLHIDEEAVSWDELKEAEGEYDEDIAGVLLDPRLVKTARAKEMEFVKPFGVYKKCL